MKKFGLSVNSWFATQILGFLKRDKKVQSVQLLKRAFFFIHIIIMCVHSLQAGSFLSLSFSPLYFPFLAQKN